VNISFYFACSTEETTTTTAYDTLWVDILSSSETASGTATWTGQAGALSNLNCYPNVASAWAIVSVTTSTTFNGGGYVKPRIGSTQDGSNVTEFTVDVVTYTVAAISSSAACP